jgi:hypothetical protein
MVLFFTGVFYFLSITMLKNYFDASYIGPEFFVKISMIVGITWLPLHALKIIIEIIDPEEHKKIADQGSL